MCPSCGSHDLKRGEQNLWCNSCGYFPIPFEAAHREGSCDACSSQEGRHYCLLHSRQMKNMDLLRCDDFTRRETKVDGITIQEEHRWRKSFGCFKARGLMGSGS